VSRKVSFERTEQGFGAPKEGTEKGKKKGKKVMSLALKRARKFISRTNRDQKKKSGDPERKLMHITKERPEQSERNLRS